MNKILLLTIALLFGFNTEAAVKRYFSDAKWPTQQMIEKQTFTNPVAASTSYVVFDTGGNTTTTAVALTSGLTNPDIPRNLTITPAGSTGTVAECTITVTGTNIKGEAITEDFAFAADASTATTGSKAFKTVTQVDFPANCEDSDYSAVWKIGVGEKLGVNKCLANAGDILHSLIDGAKEGTAPTMAVDVDDVEGNTVDFDGTMDGSSDFVLYFMQNYRCD